MQQFEFRVPSALANAIALNKLNPDKLLIRETSRLMYGEAPLSIDDVGQMLGPDAVYISGAGADPVILHTVGSSYEVGRRLIEIGRLLCEECSN